MPRVSLKDVARNYAANYGELKMFLKFSKPIPYEKDGDGEFFINDTQVDMLIVKFIESGNKANSDPEQANEDLRFLLEEERRIKQNARSMPITSGPNFEGYRITRYGGYVSGDEATVLSDSFFGAGFSKDLVNNAIKAIRVVAIEELKIAAAEIGCNAVIGLDFDYVTIDRQYQGLSGLMRNETYLILTANGTAVEIEEIE